MANPLRVRARILSIWWDVLSIPWGRGHYSAQEGKRLLRRSGENVKDPLGVLHGRSPNQVRSPKPGRCALPGRVARFGPAILPSRDDGRDGMAQRPALGERGAFWSEKPVVFCTTSRLGREAPLSGAWRPDKAAGQRFALLGRSPKPGTCSSKILPSEDVVQDGGELLSPTVVFLPRRDDARSRLAGRPCLGEECPF